MLMGSRLRCVSAGGLNSHSTGVGFRPQCRGDSDRIHSGVLPPFGFVAAVVNFAVVATAERHRELVAYLAPERGMLGKAEVMSVRRLAATEEAWLLGNESHMSLVAHPARLRNRESTLIDAGWL
jgi:hypothetical protein